MTEDEWQVWTNSIPQNPKHITITGGEPFLAYEYIHEALKTINEEYPETEVLILTNGRILSIQRIFDLFAPLFTDKYCIAVPVHGPTEELHDAITQSPGSFKQTMKALHLLSTTSVKIEARIVGHRNNLAVLSDTFKMLARTGARIEVINLIAMEMTGSAGRHRDELWVDYKDVCHASHEGILYAILHGFNVGLYNFPLCTVPQSMWPLVKDSITPYKVRYPDTCNLCSLKHACGGLFYSTYELRLCKTMPFIEEK